MPIRSYLPVGTLCAVALIVSGCEANAPPANEEADVQPKAGQFVAQAGHSPPFARLSYAPFTRAEAVAIAQQEWRLSDARPPGLQRPPSWDGERRKRRDNACAPLEFSNLRA